MTRAVSQTPSDLVLSSTTETQEQLEHAVSENWKDPFISEKDKEAAKAKEVEDAKAVLAETEEGKEPEDEHAEETPEQRAQRIADEAEPVKGNWSKRVNKLTARNARIAEELRTEREAREKLEVRLASLERGEKPTSSNDGSNAMVGDLPGKPKRIDFKDEETYVSALIKYERANEDFKEQQTELRAHAEKVFREHGARIEEARSRYDDWEEVADAANDMPIPPQVDFAIREMSNGADVLYFLAKNPKAYEKMSAMSPSQQVIEAGRISDRLIAANPNGNGNGKPRRQRTPAPEPITPGGRRPTTQGKKLDDMEMDEYYRARMAQRAQRRAH